MTYFIVLPLFLAWLVVSVIASLVLRVKCPEWHGRRYFFHASLWSSIGVLGGNALLIIGLGFGLQLIESSGNSEGFFQFLVRVFWGASAILGPLLASTVGWGLGILVGLAIAYLRARNAS